MNILCMLCVHVAKLALYRERVGKGKIGSDGTRLSWLLSGGNTEGRMGGQTFGWTNGLVLGAYWTSSL